MPDPMAGRIVHAEVLTERNAVATGRRKPSWQWSRRPTSPASRVEQVEHEAWDTERMSASVRDGASRRHRLPRLHRGQSRTSQHEWQAEQESRRQGEAEDREVGERGP